MHLFRLSYRTNSVNSICPIRQVECTSNHLPSASQKGSSHRVQVYSWKRYGRSGECPKPACKLQTTDVYVPLAVASHAVWATALPSWALMEFPAEHTARCPLIEGETGENGLGGGVNALSAIQLQTGNTAANMFHLACTRLCEKKKVLAF